jgi:hypothetical protein
MRTWACWPCRFCWRIPLRIGAASGDAEALAACTRAAAALEEYRDACFSFSFLPPVRYAARAARGLSRRAKRDYLGSGRGKHARLS